MYPAFYTVGVAQPKSYPIANTWVPSREAVCTIPTWPGHEHTTYCMRGGHFNHSAISMQLGHEPVTYHMRCGHANHTAILPFADDAHDGLDGFRDVQFADELLQRESLHLQLLLRLTHLTKTRHLQWEME